MSDLISRSALIKKIEERIRSGIFHDASYYMLERFKAMVREAPTVEAKPVVHGEWKRIGGGSLYDTYECTNCHRPPKWDCLGDNHWRIAFTDICPHCGADMRGEKYD